MLKESLLYLARQERIRQFVITNPAARGMARRFVAGETLDDAISATRPLNARHIAVSLDHLGENVADAHEATATADEYITTLKRISAEGGEANISIKLTALGLDIDAGLCQANLGASSGGAQERHLRARGYGRLGLHGAHARYGCRMHRELPNVGTVLQIDALSHTIGCRDADSGGRARPAGEGRIHGAAIGRLPAKADVDEHTSASCASCWTWRLSGLATHDEHIITDAKRFAAEHRYPHARFEFQMLYGIRRDLQERLASDGYNVRIYVPYGSQWYPYLTRRMAERPANLMFIVSNTLRG